jgi:hypothetical protein
MCRLGVKARACVYSGGKKRANGVLLIIHVLFKWRTVRSRYESAMPSSSEIVTGLPRLHAQRRQGEKDERGKEMRGFAVRMSVMTGSRAWSSGQIA